MGRKPLLVLFYFIFFLSFIGSKATSWGAMKKEEIQKELRNWRTKKSKAEYLLQADFVIRVSTRNSTEAIYIPVTKEALTKAINETVFWSVEESGKTWENSLMEVQAASFELQSQSNENKRKLKDFLAKVNKIIDNLEREGAALAAPKAVVAGKLSLRDVAGHWKCILTRDKRHWMKVDVGQNGPASAVFYDGSADYYKPDPPPRGREDYEAWLKTRETQWTGKYFWTPGGSRVPKQNETGRFWGSCTLRVINKEMLYMKRHQKEGIGTWMGEYDCIPWDNAWNNPTDKTLK